MIQHCAKIFYQIYLPPPKLYSIFHLNNLAYTNPTSLLFLTPLRIVLIKSLVLKIIHSSKRMTNICGELLIFLLYRNKLSIKSASVIVKIPH